MNRIAKSIKISTIANDIIEQLRIVPGTKRLKSYNSIIEELIEKSPDFIKQLKKNK